MYQYAYLTGSGLLGMIWFYIFLRRKDLRKEMLWASLIGLPFGLIEILFVPNYWYPQSLFNLMRQYGFGIEGFIYSFSIAGIAAVAYEFLEKKKPKKIKSDKKIHLLALVIFLVVFIGLEFFLPQKPMLNLSAAFICGAILVGYRRRDLSAQIVASGFMFGFFYLLLFSFDNYLFGDLVSKFYAFQIFDNFKIIGVPIEEIIGAFTGGAFWSVLYEYTRAYREVAE